MYGFAWWCTGSNTTTQSGVVCKTKHRRRARPGMPGWSSERRRRGARRRLADQPRPAAVRRGRGHQTGPRGLPRRGRRPHRPELRTGRSRLCECAAAKSRSCRRTSRSTPRRGCGQSRSGRRRQREVSYALCNDRRTLLWFANQRAVEYHPTLFRVDRNDRSTHLVLDLDPPSPAEFPLVVRAAELVRQAITDVGLAGAVKTSGAKECTSSYRSTSRRRSRRSPQRRAPSRLGPSALTRRWPPPRSSRMTAAARCSSTRPGQAAQRWWPRTAHE